MDQFPRISVDPEVMGGKPCIKGTRVTVGMLVGLLAAGHSEKELLELYPYIRLDDIRAALAYAAWLAQTPEGFLRNAS